MTTSGEPPLAIPDQTAMGIMDETGDRTNSEETNASAHQDWPAWLTSFQDEISTSGEPPLAIPDQTAMGTVGETGDRTNSEETNASAHQDWPPWLTSFQAEKNTSQLGRAGTLTERDLTPKQLGRRKVAVYIAVSVISLVVVIRMLVNLYPGGEAERPLSSKVAPVVVAVFPSLPASPVANDVPQAIPTMITPVSTPPFILEPTAIPGKARPSPFAPTAAVLLQQVAKAEAALRTGEFEATIDFSGGSSSSATMLFDLGDQNYAPRLFIQTKYQGAKDTQTIEYITMGNRSWQRPFGGTWTTAKETEVVWEQLQVYLPHAGLVSNADIAGDVLYWHDANRDTEVSLQIDPATGIPRKLRRHMPTTGSWLTVLYLGWNSTVAIAAPER